MNKDEYIIINKTAIQKRIEELENRINNDGLFPQELQHFIGQIKALNQILSQSTPLIPEIEKAHKKGFTEGTCFGATTIYKYKTSEDYISNLKLDI
jgi:wobble nucleotide-excising tRNase